MAGLFPITFGGEVLDAVAIDESAGRELLSLEPTSGAGGRLLDRGPRVRRTRVRLLFAQRAGEEPDDPVERRRAFEALADGVTRLFSHPIHGSYPAKASIEREQVEPGLDEIEVLFIEDRDSDLSPARPGAGRLPRAGAQTVAVAAERVTEQLDALGEASEVPGACVELAETWTEAGQTDARQVYVDLGAQSAAIETEIARLGAGSDLDRYALFVRWLELASELARAAEAATAATAATFELRVTETTNLIALCAGLYGAEEALDRYEQARALNRIDTPLSVPAGAVLVLPTATA